MGNITPAASIFVSSWNSHRIQGPAGRIPLILASTQSISPINCIPTVDQVINMYLNEDGSRLSPDMEVIL